MLVNASGAIQAEAGSIDERTLRGRDIVCVSVMDWDWPFWTSRHHLMNELSRSNRVLFIDPPLTFASDYIRARRDPRLRRKLIGWTRNGGLRSVHDNLQVWSPPPAIPFNRVSNRHLYERMLAIDQGLFRFALRRTLRRLDIRQPILWVSFNVYYGDAVVGQLGEALSVYHCTDEVTGFPGYSRFISAVEARLTARSDVVLASSEVLRDDKARFNPNSHFVPNGADVELFERALSWTGPEPDDLRRLPSPRVGFIGNIEYRFDAALMRYAADRLPEWSFVLIGPLQDGYPDVEALRHLPNVHFLGLKARADLPAYLAGLDVTLIPYRMNRLTQGIYPLKVHEYLAAGKPVVATPIPSLRQLADRVYLAADGPSFVDAIERAVREDGPNRQEARRQLARRETWAARAAEISGILGGALHDKQERHLTMLTAPSSGSSKREGVRPAGSDRMSAFPRTTSQTPPHGGPSFGSFLRLGRQLALRHRNPLKRLAYQLLGDLNVHRRVRSAHVVRALDGAIREGAEVLDAGCGEGACSFALAEMLRPVRVTGIDVDPASVAACRAVAAGLPDYDVHFEQADVTSLTYSDRFDAVVCSEVLEHVSEDQAALQGLHRALKPGGRLVVHVPLRHRLQRRILPGYRAACVADHVREEYVREEIVEKVEQTGFRIERVGSTFGPAGELAFELNTLPVGTRLGRLMALFTLPAALLLAYLDVMTYGRAVGNSLLVVAHKAQPDAAEDVKDGET
jgi:2-polyprenyl-3-methyl-5-hydroxy-6-metoxy-1,4-benzoquinol methylase/glycosyltransferase involved in cell wall biosynthesis